MNGSREVMKAALQVLQRRFHSKQELRRKLQAKGADDEAVAEVVRQLEGWRYLDDASLCRRQLQALLQEGRYGRLRVEQVLRQKGFAQADIEAAWASAEEAPSEEQRALALLQRRRLDAADEQRLLRFLWQKGFAVAAARRAVAAYREGTGVSP